MENTPPPRGALLSSALSTHPSAPSARPLFPLAILFRDVCLLSYTAAFLAALSQLCVAIAPAFCCLRRLAFSPCSPPLAHRYPSLCPWPVVQRQAIGTPAGEGVASHRVPFPCPSRPSRPPPTLAPRAPLAKSHPPAVATRGPPPWRAPAGAAALRRRRGRRVDRPATPGGSGPPRHAAGPRGGPDASSRAGTAGSTSPRTATAGDGPSARRRSRQHLRPTARPALRQGSGLTVAAQRPRACLGLPAASSRRPPHRHHRPRRRLARPPARRRPRRPGHPCSSLRGYARPRGQRQSPPRVSQPC